MANVLRTVGIWVGYGYEALGLLRVGVCFENLGVFPFFLPFLFDLSQKFHETV
jgi:hypothetical protein